jgi:hypothetical protein
MEGAVRLPTVVLVTENFTLVGFVNRKTLFEATAGSMPPYQAPPWRA